MKEGTVKTLVIIGLGIVITALMICIYTINSNRYDYCDNNDVYLSISPTQQQFYTSCCNCTPNSSCVRTKGTFEYDENHIVYRAYGVIQSKKFYPINGDSEYAPRRIRTNYEGYCTVKYQRYYKNGCYRTYFLGIE